MICNINTDRLLVCNYPSGAGGKFILLTLALHPNFLHQHSIIAKFKQQGKLQIKDSYNISKWVLQKSKKIKKHFELGCFELSGTVDHKNLQEKSNSFFRELTNQNKFYMAMTQHGSEDVFKNWPNAKNLILQNFEWILEARNEGYEINFNDGRANRHYFDMESVKDQKKFLIEIENTFKWLGLDTIDPSFVEGLRCIFMETFKIGFK